jgi:uncharacterized protein YutE (UPF0331/DUF86 family)
MRFIQDNLELLREMSSIDEATFVGDRVKFYAAVHALQISIEAVLDIFTHIIARLHLGVPTSDLETLQVAKEKKLESEEHFQRFWSMNKFRNKVVHGYMDVDAKQLYKTLHRDLGDFQLFFDDIRQVIAKDLAKGTNGIRRRR